MAGAEGDIGPAVALDAAGNAVAVWTQSPGDLVASRRAY
jgi:hypothetical protein